MGFFKKAKPEKKTYDREHLEPVIRKSICTGEETAGFRDKTTGQFREAMLIRNSSDLDKFCDTYEISRDTIQTIF